MTHAGVIAFGMPGYGELMMLAVIGLLIFGRRLPEVGRTVGKTLTQFRRGLDDFKAQMNADESLREVKSTVHDLRKVTEAPRVLANPKRLLEGLTDDHMATPGPEATTASPQGAEGTQGPFDDTGESGTESSTG